MQKFHVHRCFDLDLVYNVLSGHIQSAILKEVKGLMNKLYAYALAWKKTGLHVHRCFDMDSSAL